MYHDQVKSNKVCSLCKTNNYIEFIRIFCGHILCDKCLVRSLGERTIYCPECEDNFNLDLCYRITREVNPQNQIKSPPSPSISDNQYLKLKGSINSLSDMISQVRQFYIGCDSEYLENKSNVLKMFENLKQRIESNQKVVLDKIMEIKVINQKYLIEWRDLLNKEINRRKEFLIEVDKVRSGIENNELIEKLSEFQDFTSQILNLSKFKFDENHEEKTEKFISDNLTNFFIFTVNVPIDWKAQDYREIEPKQREKISGNIIEAELKESPCSMKQFPNKEELDEGNHPHPRCQWFIEVSDDLKPLPFFVCDQIDKYKPRKNFIYILKAGSKINFADIEKMLYYHVDPNGIKSKPHRLIYIP